MQIGVFNNFSAIKSANFHAVSWNLTPVLMQAAAALTWQLSA
jgi:hypothetical protein